MEDKIIDYDKLLSQITHEKKLLFLQEYPKYNVTIHTSRAIGISDDLIYQWNDKDEIFNKAFKALKKRIDNTRLQRYEAELDKRILENPSKQSDILLMFALKAHAPEKYREKTETHISGDIKVVSYIPRPDKPLQIAERSVANGQGVTAGEDSVESEALQGSVTEDSVTD